jgi:hypothetical protein
MSMLARKRAAILTRADAIAEDPDKASVRDCLVLIVALVLVLLRCSQRDIGSCWRSLPQACSEWS